MNAEIVRTIVRKCTRLFRKTKDRIVEDVVDGKVLVRVVDYPTLIPSEVNEEIEEVYDLHYVHVVVNNSIAFFSVEPILDELRSMDDQEALARGMNYLEFANLLGDMDDAFRLLAVGAACGWWNLITPAEHGFSDLYAEDLAAKGYIAASGFRA